MLLKTFVFFLIFSIIKLESARILGIFYVPMYSHHILGETLLKALAERGHQVTMISPLPIKTPIPDLEHVHAEGILQSYKEITKTLMDLEKLSVANKFAAVYTIFLKGNEDLLKEAAVKDLLNANRTFDLVILDWVVSEVLLGFGHHYNAPTIALSPIGASNAVNRITSNSAPYSYVPSLMISSTDKMNFFGRLKNTLLTIPITYLLPYLLYPAQNEILHTYFPNAPPLQELIENVSLVFVNSHFSIETPRPYVPNIIQIGGMHIKEPKLLESDLQEFMDGSPEGVLYFSLGSNAVALELRNDQIDAIVRTFAKLPVKVLWKFETAVPMVSSNVKVSKWLPQTDILAHPNLKVFVTHGGLLSTIEATYRAIPMVGIPSFADQRGNVELAVNQGYSVMVLLEDLTEATLTNAVVEVLTNSSYKENARRRSQWLKDQPISPLDKAVYWVEYMLRHEGALHLRNSSIKLKWYQYLLLDVIILFLIIIMIVFYLIKQIIKSVNMMRIIKTKKSM